MLSAVLAIVNLSVWPSVTRWYKVDLRVGSTKSTWVDLGLPSGVKSVCSGVTVEIFWRRRSHYLLTSHFKSTFQVDLTNKLAPSSSLIQVIRSCGWVWANRAICRPITSFSNQAHILVGLYWLGYSLYTGYRVSTLHTAIIVGWRTCESAYRARSMH